MAIDHFVLHPDIPFIHLPDQVNVLFSDCANIKLLQTLYEVSLLELVLNFGPDFVQRGIVMPVHTSWHWRHRVPQNHHGEDWLDNQVVRLYQVAQFSVFLEEVRGMAR